MLCFEAGKRLFDTGGVHDLSIRDTVKLMHDYADHPALMSVSLSTVVSGVETAV